LHAAVFAHTISNFCQRLWRHISRQTCTECRSNAMAKVLSPPNGSPKMLWTARSARVCQRPRSAVTQGQRMSRQST